MAKSYIIQKAVEFSKVKKKLAAGIDLSTYEQQAKSDGCCAILKFDARGEYLGCWSRTGERYVSMDSVGYAMSQYQRIPDPAGLVAFEQIGPFINCAVIGEAWWPGKGEFNNISGEFRRGKISERLQFVINDVIPLDQFEAGSCSQWYSERVKHFRDIATERFYFTQRWAPGSSDPQERCNQLVQAGGYDGLVLRDLHGTWTVGSGNTGEIIKIKQKLSFDLKVIEINVVPGAKTGRDVYKLVVEFNGRRLGVGSGVPHKLAEVPKLGDIVEVEAMDYSSDGLLREPRFKTIRFDKIKAD